MHRKLLFIPVLLALLVGFSFPALAITFGTPDGNSHPYVGSIVLDVAGIGLFQHCTGTLISEDVFLTASHCTFRLDNFLNNYPGSRVLVTFDPTISPQSTFYTGTWITHPNYTDFKGKYGRSNPSDVAVILLDESPGITPARLPEAGLLDRLKADNLLNDTRFTAVGYGALRDELATGFAGILDNLDRNRAEQGFNSLTPAWLNLPMLPTTGNGGTCYGDSGGPHFIHLNGQETDIVAAITVTGDSVCKATDVTYRMDTAYVQSFLSRFVDLP